MFKRNYSKPSMIRNDAMQKDRPLADDAHYSVNVSVDFTSKPFSSKQRVID